MTNVEEEMIDSLGVHGHRRRLVLTASDSTDYSDEETNSKVPEEGWNRSSLASNPSRHYENPFVVRRFDIPSSADGVFLARGIHILGRPYTG